MKRTILPESVADRAVPRDGVGVIIVGAGPVGLALAIECGTRGVACLVVEERDRGRLVPRAKLANVRTMEHMRRWGIADEVRSAAPLSADFSTDIAFVTSVFGREITRFTNVFFTGSERDARFAEAAQQIPQYVLEPVLRRAAERLPSVRFLDGWRVDNVSERDHDVVARIVRDGHAPADVRGRYLVGCDGAGSTVRERTAIVMRGDRGLAQNLGVVFRAPTLEGLLPFRPALHFWTVNDATPSYMGPADRSGLWWLQATAIDQAVDLAKVDPKDVVAGALGERIPVEIVNVDPWRAHAMTAEHVREGRIFLAGDAAHVHSPMGAHGMNQGIGDAVDLGWKLAAVLQGWGGEQLLESYAIERQPVHARLTAEATHNYNLVANHFVRPGLDADTSEGRRLREEVAADIQARKRREFFSLGLVLGNVYEHSPVVAGDFRSAHDADSTVFAPTLLAGGRTPHAWRDDGSSLFDHFGLGFTLLHFEGADRSSVQEAADEVEIPVRIVAIDEPHIRGLYDAQFVLVRPDQVVAWHGDRLPADFRGLFDLVRGGTGQANRV